ncbi:respiratory-chain NADH dehydrogenase 51 kDa subunit protein [Gemella morbillorum M424]|uniref:Proline reductase-associated electron transfer protein PrdC n=2 Tax=Gemella morbillorum TaxID=29391 RepID=A0AAP9HCA2_9BACL|nr:proline reductase-associated electron transfer protein PrdC [Gemella morbillorum]EFV34938.1 respiratory-chain NADH dehydrogenase 51 kDa subunit protein [Gemella morbillorum M424]QGS09008.1 proline reductase-associated electron transfer protein PrdC [Gemella morbillorum]
MIEFDVEKIHIPLKQHVGGPCQAIVNVGDHVKRGQLVAVPAGLGANIHASLSGVVEEITEMDIVVKLDKEQTDDYVRLEKTDDYLQKIKDAGIVGVGGAGFPTGIKFSTQIPGGYLIANAAECEPILGHNVKFMEEQPEVLVRGMKYIMELTGAKEGYIAIKTKYRKALLALGKACKDEPNISIKILPNMYPAGDERVIVRETLGVILQPGQLPLEANAIISNVETIKHVVNAIEEDKPLIDKDLTVGGRVQNPSIFLDVPIGLPISVFIERAGGYINPHGEIVRGGPFTGRPAKEDEPINKTTGGLLVAMPYPQEKEKVGILICECGAQEERLRQIADGMGAEVVSVQMCKRMKPDKNGRLRCELPGICPGQAEKVLKMKKDGAKAVIAGTCQD